MGFVVSWKAVNVLSKPVDAEILPSIFIVINNNETRNIGNEG
ncbi:hypothetical protein [Paraflavitalea speifideaquila]|nr:hypothetical protein [Paraflavitalea speifideiaquila]